MNGPRLFACSNPYTLGGWAAAVSTDHGAAFTPIATFDGVRGALPCDAGAGALCGAYWPDVHKQIARSRDAAAPTPNDGGTAGEEVRAPAASRRSCGCHTKQGSNAPGSLAILLAIAFLKRRMDRPSANPDVGSSTSRRLRASGSATIRSHH
jgi:hypothetical protein